MEIPSTQPTPRSTLCRVTNGQCTSASLLDVNSCAPVLEIPAMSGGGRQHTTNKATHGTLGWKHSKHQHGKAHLTAPAKHFSKNYELDV